MNIGELLNLARTLERTEIQAKGMEKPGKNDNGNATSVNRIQKQTSKHKYKQNPSKHNPLHTTQTKAKGKQTCQNCGGIWPHINGKQSCPAYGRKCHSCSRSNHFARCCRSKEREKQAPRFYKRYPAHKVAVSEETDGSDEEYVFVVSPARTQTKLSVPQAQVKIHNCTIPVMIDSGAHVNILDETAYQKLSDCKLSYTNAKIHPYGCDKPLSVKGKFSSEVTCEGSLTTATFFVVRGHYGSLLSYTTATELNLINIRVNQIKDNDSIVFPEVFSEEIGKLKYFQVHLHINKDIKPVKQTHRRIPFHMRKQVEKELVRLENQGIIETVTGPTPWVSPIVVIPKANPSEIRMCIDMREANKAIERERPYHTHLG